MQQLSSRGLQDSHLSIAPETSFWKRTYKRVSNYVTEAINIEIPTLTWGQTRTVPVTRTGDLLTKLYLVLEINLLALGTPGADHIWFCNALGHACINYVTFEVGNNEVDRLTGDFLEILHEVNSTMDKDMDECVLRGANVAELQDWAANGNAMDSTGADIIRLYIHLPFYFSLARSQAFPVVACQAHDIRVKLSLRTFSELVVYSNAGNTTLDATNDGAINNAYLMGMFVFLDSLERRLFAANEHEYLVKNLQTSDFHTKAASATRVSATVVFGQPVTAFFWFARTTVNLDANDYFNWELTPDQGDDPLVTATIKLNGAEREKARDALFYRKIVPSEYFNKTPSKNLYCYSFSMNPLAWFPAGSINLSRIDTTSIDFVFRADDANGDPFGEANITVIAVNFNVVRFSGGMCSLKYSS